MSRFIPVHVHVQFPNGDPAADALLGFESSSAPLPEMALLTNSQGQVRMDLPVGTFRLAARKGEARGTVDFQIDRNSTSAPLTIVLRDAGPG